ncbi:hypothetical protein [Sphingomonas sp. SRS2]|uniref:hypothetical protein n=1 Tax=Sphingomonas sp. SRS2 TaxID=133190 RepID=UPI0006184A6B|nr:hypothetical protein [Sphingomonas sp. SRS2]KKC25751.1 hypothetical protein WP12_11835 [Sphingomonas sp. SRS2]
MPSQALATFIRSTFRSVWALELLLLIAGEGARSWSQAELVAALRASELIVARAIEELAAAGLVLIEQDMRVRFGPVSDDLRDMTAMTGALYARSPDKIRRMIVSAGTDGLTAFSDAFRIRKD